MIDWPPPGGSWCMSDLPEPDKDDPTVLSTFAGGGGSSLGYRLAGYRVVGAVDLSPQQCKAYRAAMPSTPVVEAPVSDMLVQGTEAHDLAVPWADGRLDVLDGSPPCTLFSQGNLGREDGWGKQRVYVEGVTAQILDRLFMDYLDVVDLLRPKVFVAENVTGMLVGRAKWYAREVVRLGTGLGYRVQALVVSAASQGVPQVRERLFFVGVRTDVDHGTALVVPPVVDRAVHAASVLTEHTCGQDAACRRGVPTLAAARARGSKGHTELLPERGPTTALAVSDYLVARDRHGFYRVHERDLMRVASFPDDYPVLAYSRATFVTRQAVPPGLARGVALAVRRWMGWGEP